MIEKMTIASIIFGMVAASILILRELVREEKRKR